MAMHPDPTKVMGRRVGASLIDGVVVFVPFVLYQSSRLEYVDTDDLGGVSATDYCDAYTDRLDGICISAGDRVYFGEAESSPALVLIGVSVLIYVILQGLAGWTIGKLLTGIRVVREDGSRPGLVKALVRWLFWIVDGLPVGGLVGFIVGLTSTGHRRVGDMVAKTFVVRKAAAGQPVLIPGLTLPPAAPGEGWSTADAAVPTAPVAKHGPQWDEARGTYIQWDPEQSAWMQWNDSDKLWSRLPGQEPDAPPPPPVAPPPPPPPPL